MSQNVSRLKELLFDRESATLAELKARIDGLATSEHVSREELRGALEALISREAADRKAMAERLETVLRRAGSEEQFRTSVADVLDAALREAEIKRHDPLARAMAPLVVKTIKTELRNSQDEMVEALYPITGRLVKSYVASAMKDLMEQINRRLAGGSNPVMLRVRSLFTGRSVAELALAETQRLEVVELFLIRRGSGELLQHWPDRPSGGGVGSNSDIHLSGVLTAINDFAAEALKGDGGNLRAFALDDFQMYLRASPAHLLAAKCRGSGAAGVEAVLDEEFLNLVERKGRELATAGPTSAPLLPPLAERLQERLDERQRALANEIGLGFNPLKVMAIVVALPLLAFAGWAIYSSYETARVREQATAAIEAVPSLAGYPIQLDVGPRGREVALTGLVPTAAAKAAVEEKLRQRLPKSNLQDRLTVLPNQAAEFEPQLSRLRRELAGIESDAVRNTVRRSLARSTRRIEQSLPHLRALPARLTDKTARETAAAAATGVETVLTDMRQLQARFAGASVDVAQLSALSAPMHGLAERLQRTSAGVNGLLAGGGASVELGHGDAAPADVQESAEELGLAAEQLATITVAVAQSASLKPPAPVIAPPAPTPRERLALWIKSNAVFFGDNTDFKTPPTTEAMLNVAAALIRDAKVLVRVVGYTDDRGGAPRNGLLSQQRAQRVVDALVERGVPRQMLVAVGRPSGGDISPATGAQSPNRRVEFEIGFDGEVAEQP